MIRPSKTEQLSLFDETNYATPEKLPGEMSMDEWVGSQRPGYHGSYRGDFESAPVAHYGSIGQAAFRLHDVGNYFDKGSNAKQTNKEYYGTDQGPGPVHTGNVYARRFSTKPAPFDFSDATANAAEAGLLYENDMPVPPGPRQSAGEMEPIYGVDDNGFPEAQHKSEVVERAHDYLDKGIPIRYHNTIEGRNPYDTAETETLKSVVAPPSAVTSWEQDVLSTPTASPMAQRFAQQRIDQGREGAVAFPTNYKGRAPEQLRLDNKVDRWDTRSRPVTSSLQFKNHAWGVE